MKGGYMIEKQELQNGNGITRRSFLGLLQSRWHP